MKQGSRRQDPPVRAPHRDNLLGRLTTRDLFEFANCTTIPLPSNRNIRKRFDVEVAKYGQIHTIGCLDFVTRQDYIVVGGVGEHKSVGRRHIIVQLSRATSEWLLHHTNRSANPSYILNR